MGRSGNPRLSRGGTRRKQSEKMQKIQKAQDACAQGGRSGGVIRGWVRKSGVPEVEGAAFRGAEWIDLAKI